MQEGRERHHPLPENNIRLNMENRIGGLLISSRSQLGDSIQHPASQVKRRQKMPSGARSFTLANITDGSEDDRYGEGGQLKRASSPQSTLQDTKNFEARIQSYPAFGGGDQEAGESTVGGGQCESPTRAQHESFGEEEEYAEVHDSVLAQHRKFILLSRLQETYPNGRLTMVRRIVS